MTQGWREKLGGGGVLSCPLLPHHHRGLWAQGHTLSPLPRAPPVVLARPDRSQAPPPPWLCPTDPGGWEQTPAKRLQHLAASSQDFPARQPTRRLCSQRGRMLGASKPHKIRAGTCTGVPHPCMPQAAMWRCRKNRSRDAEAVITGRPGRACATRTPHGWGLNEETRLSPGIGLRVQSKGSDGQTAARGGGWEGREAGMQGRAPSSSALVKQGTGDDGGVGAPRWR